MHTLMVIDDSKFVRFKIKELLTAHGYEIIEAENGKEAFEILENTAKLPDLIICDIIMPEMDGYSFYSDIAIDQKFNHIPFIFLSVKSTVEDIRIGKMLGVDDYLNKPFLNEDLIASVKGKLVRKLIVNQFQSQLNERQKQESIKEISECLPMANSDSIDKCIYFLHVRWDNVWGPVVSGKYSSVENPEIDFKQLAEQLYNVCTAVYGYESFYEAEDVLLRIANLKMDGYLFFDTILDKRLRGGGEIFMLAVVAPSIHYFAAQQMKPKLKSMAEIIKTNKEIDISTYFQQIIEIMQKEAKF